jgi:nicotinamide-nucleotide adenylyltransferase
MNEKAFNLGVLVGRFQTIHSGHEMMIDTALSLCGQVGIFIGSSQESGTAKNPFSYELRKSLLEKLYGDRIKIYPLADLGVGNNSTWGEYVLKNIKDNFGSYPDLLVSGKESRRVSWFDGIEGANVAELYIPKSIDISASCMREFFLNGDFESWKTYTNPILWSEFDKLKELVKASKDNTETASL